MAHPNHGESRRFLVTLCNSGTEAVKAAIKHALMEWQKRRRDLLHTLEMLREKATAREELACSHSEYAVALTRVGRASASSRSCPRTGCTRARRRTRAQE